MDESDEGDEHVVLPPIPAKPQKTLFSYFNSNRTNSSVKGNTIDCKQTTQVELNKPRKFTSKDKDKNINSCGISISLFGGSAVRKIKKLPRDLKQVSNHERVVNDRSKDDVKYNNNENDHVEEIDLHPEKINKLHEDLNKEVGKSGEHDDQTTETMAEINDDIDSEDGKGSALDDSQCPSQGNESDLNTTADEGSDEASKTQPKYQNGELQNAGVILHDCNVPDFQDIRQKNSNSNSNDFEELNSAEECTASPVTKVRKRRKLKQQLKSDTDESSTTELSDTEESCPIEMTGVINPQKIVSTPCKNVVRSKQEREKHFDSCSDEIISEGDELDGKMEESFTKSNESPNKVKRKQRMQQQFESSDEELELDSTSCLIEQIETNNDSNKINLMTSVNEMNHSQDCSSEEVNLSQNKGMELEKDVTKCLEIAAVNKIDANMIKHSMYDDNKCGDGKKEFVSNENEEEPRKLKLIGSIYPTSTVCSEYKGLIDLTDTTKVCIEIPVMNDFASRTTEDYLKMLQTEYPDIPVRKIFLQFLDCQKTVITKNLTKARSSRKVLENLWERDSKLKSEEIAIAEEIRRKNEEIALAELKKKMRNDIRSSFQRTKRRRKKVDKDIVTVEDENGSSAKSKEESCKGGKKSKENIVTEDMEEEDEQFDTSKDNRNTGKKNRVKCKSNKLEEAPITLEGSEDIGIVTNDIRLSFKRMKPMEMSKGKSGELDNPKDATENRNVCKEKEKRSKNKKKKITDMIEFDTFDPKEENCGIPSENKNESCKRSQRKRQSKTTSETMVLIDSIDEINDKSSQRRKNRRRSKTTEEKIGSKNENECEEDSSFNLALEETKKVQKQKSKSIIDMMIPKSSSDKISKENTSEVAIEKELIGCGTSKDKEEKDEHNTNQIKSARRKKKIKDINENVDEGSDLNSSEKKITEIAENSQEILTNKTKKSNRIPSPLEEVRIVDNLQNIGELTNCKVEELDISNSPGLDNQSEYREQSEINDEQMSNSRKRRLQRSNSGARKKMKLLTEKPVTRRRSSRNQTISIKLDESDTSENINTVQTENVKDVDVVSENVIKNENLSEKENIENILDSTQSTKGNIDTPNLRRSSRARKPVIPYTTQISEFHDVKDISMSMSLEENEYPDVDVKNESDDSIIETTSSQANVEETQVLKTTLDRAMETLDLLEQSPRKSPRKPILDVKLDEEYVNSCLSWTEKYQPNKARHVIGNKEDTRKIFDWLLLWKDRHESALRKMVRSENLSKQYKSDYSDSDDSEDSEFEDYLSNTMILTGPCGSGTTATVYACANQLDFKVLELNPTMYRTGKQIFDQVSEAVVSHQVNKLADANDEKMDVNSVTKKGNFFKPKKELDLVKKSSNSTKNKADRTVKPSNSSLSSTSADAMSLILFEQVDIIYDELDRGFYQGITDLRNLAKRPIILTANNAQIIENIFPEDDSWVDHISLSYPSNENLLPIIQVMCLVEHVFVPRSMLIDIMQFCKNDIRKTLLQLMFWCDQGKKPLFKIWKSKKKKSMDSSKSIFELNMAGTNETAMEDKVDSTDDETILITKLSSNILPVYEDQSFLSIDRILEEEKCCSSVHMSYSFSKCTPKDQFSTLEHLAETVNGISEMNSIFSSLNQNFYDIDNYVWTSTLSDSLSGDLPKERERIFNHPMNPICKNVEKIYEQKYEKLISVEQHRFNVRKNISHSELYKSVLKSNSAKYHINRTPFLQDILPYMNKICQIEELKLSGLHNRKRGNRRYTHYLDTCGIYLEEGPMKELSKPFGC